MTPRKIVDGIELRKCTYCKDFLPLDNFYKQTKSGDGLSYRCKGCMDIPTTPDYVKDKSKEVLEILGYDTDPNNPISVYKQFLMRHNL